MSTLKSILGQRYFLSFFTTNLLIALTTQSSLAFSINTNNILPGRGDTQETYTLPNQRTGITRLVPIKPISITRGGTPEFLATLRREFPFWSSDIATFPTWSFNAAPNDLAGQFDIGIYDAEKEVGASLGLEYKPGAGDPTPQNNNLRWIQRVVSNHSHSGNHGQNEDFIDDANNVFGNNNPFYYDTPTLLQERVFFKSVFREDANRDHNWLAQLYLVEEIGSRQVIIHNGIQWGWENRVESVPEPLTILASGISLGFGVLFKKTFKEREDNKKP
jgi:hypothetical protein